VSITAAVLWLSNVFQPVQEVGEEQHEMNQQLAWIEQPREVYSNLKWYEEKGVLIRIDTRGQSSKGAGIVSSGNAWECHSPLF